MYDKGQDKLNYYPATGGNFVYNRNTFYYTNKKKIIKKNKDSV